MHTLTDAEAVLLFRAWLACPDKGSFEALSRFSVLQRAGFTARRRADAHPWVLRRAGAIVAIEPRSDRAPALSGTARAVWLETQERMREAAAARGLIERSA